MIASIIANQGETSGEGACQPSDFDLGCKVANLDKVSIIVFELEKKADF